MTPTEAAKKTFVRATVTGAWYQKGDIIEVLKKSGNYYQPNESQYIHQNDCEIIEQPAPPSGQGEGMRWVQSKDRLPEKGKYVLFDFRENPPMYGKIEVYPGGTFITTMDSSGEEESDHLDMDSQWLDESLTPEPSREAELEKCLQSVVNHKYGEHGSQSPSWGEIIGKAKKLLNPDKEKPSIAGDLYSGA